ncbi:hypothetical protein C5748_03850 [Phyllobacterium phragmitis]|uniref:Uncharacterized protein n=1 Tax=Phyllobacterium phragmitis TaxID=2670329 RepID=A0A2S9IXW1_9HYPH|nr:phage tail tube protein [Phyllobacterium phragmitis]PRD45338.1 hypothetical protein C5748_03850 [Phyllobacterium phragmitis]
MAKRYYKKLALLAKLEANYAVDSVPTGAENAILATNATITPLAGEEVSRDLLLPYLGNQGVELVGTYVQLEFDVEVAGAGELGKAPAYGPLLRASGLSETIEVGVKVDYQPVSDGFEAASVYYNSDGVRHVMLGARGNVTFGFTPKQIPRYRFTLQGLLGTITDTPLPAVTLTGFQRPIPVSKANTTFSLFGLAGVTESVTFDLGEQVEGRFLIGSESIEITDRGSSGQAVIEATSLAIKDWFALAQDRTRGELTLVHGTVPGNTVEIFSPGVEIGRPTEGQTQNIRNYTLPLTFCPSEAGDDEITITVR